MQAKKPQEVRKMKSRRIWRTGLIALGILAAALGICFRS